MGACCSSTQYEFDNFIKISKTKPKPHKGLNIWKFQFQIHPFSTQYIHEKLDINFNEDLQAQESFLITEENKMKIFEKEQQIITKRDKISQCLKTAILGKMCGQSSINQQNFIVFVQPQGKQSYKRIILNIIIQTLIDIDLTCYNEGRRSFGVNINWPLFIKLLKQKNEQLSELIRQVHKRNKLMDSTVSSRLKQ